MFKKISIIIIVVVVIAFIIYSCNTNIDGDELEPTKETDTITLRFVNSWGGVDSNADTLNAIFREFMQENPNITIVNDSVGGSDFLTMIKTDFATNNDPDVFGIWPGSDIDAMIKAGKIADLTDLLNDDSEWKSTFGDDAWSYCTVDGRIYGLPVEIIYEALFVNKEIFDKYQLEMPKTYAELTDTIKVLAKNNIIPIAYNHEAEGTFLYQNLVVQHLSTGRVKSYKDALKLGMYDMYELYKMGAFPENAYYLSNSQRNELFLNGEAAMIVQGSWFTREIYESNMESKVEMLSFPSFIESKTGYYTLIYGLGSGTFYISQKAWDDEKKRDACIQLLRKLTSPEASAILSDESGFLSNIEMNDIQKENNKLYTRGIELINGAYYLMPPPDSVVDRDIWENIIVKEFPDIYRYGESKIENIWSKISVDD